MAEQPTGESGHPHSPPVDPDIDLGHPAYASEQGRSTVQLLGAIGAGGVLGALARAALTARAGDLAGFPTATVLVNVSGSVLIGVLMTWLAWRPRLWLLRPFLGVGVLGGYTTFSAYAVDARTLLATGHPLAGLATLVGTPALALAGVALGAGLANWWRAGRGRG